MTPPTFLALFTEIMFKPILLLFISTILLLGLSACDRTERGAEISNATSAITIIDPRIRALPPGQKVTAMYMQLQNISNKDHDLVRVESDISPMIELHTHTNNDGVMRMGKVESIPVPAKSTAEAKPGSYHVMIMGLSRDLKLGEKIDFNLVFKDGSNIPVSAEVKKLEVK